MNKFLIILIFIFSPFLINAQANPVSVATNPTALLVDHFGGRILATIPCVCNAGMMITVMDFKSKVPLILMVQPFISRINMNYSFLPGNAVLGSFNLVPTPCLNGLPPFLCVPTGTAQGIITSLPFAGIGTSLLPMPI